MTRDNAGQTLADLDRLGKERPFSLSVREAYEELASDHLRPLVAALEADGCGTPRHRYVNHRCLGCLALAALGRDIAKALKEA